MKRRRRAPPRWPAPNSGAFGARSKRSTGTPTRPRSTRPGRTWPTPIASSGTPPGWRSSSRTSATWRERALHETNPQAALEALLALAQVSAADPAHRGQNDPAPDRRRRRADLDGPRPADLVQARPAAAARRRPGHPGCPEPIRPPRRRSGRRAWRRSTTPCSLPAVARPERRDRQRLVFLEAPSAADKTVALLEAAPTQEEQIEYGRALRVLKTGWTPDLRRKYFTWLAQTGQFKGGPSLGRFPQSDHAMTPSRTCPRARRSTSSRSSTWSRGGRGMPPPRPPPRASRPRAFVKAWTLDELVPVIERPGAVQA